MSKKPTKTESTAGSRLAGLAASLPQLFDAAVLGERVAGAEYWDRMWRDWAVLGQRLEEAHDLCANELKLPWGAWQKRYLASTKGFNTQAVAAFRAINDAECRDVLKRSRTWYKNILTDATNERPPPPQYRGPYPWSYRGLYDLIQDYDLHTKNETRPVRRKPAAKLAEEITSDTVPAATIATLLSKKAPDIVRTHVHALEQHARETAALKIETATLKAETKNLREAEFTAIGAAADLEMRLKAREARIARLEEALKALGAPIPPDDAATVETVTLTQVQRGVADRVATEPQLAANDLALAKLQALIKPPPLPPDAPEPAPLPPPDPLPEPAQPPERKRGPGRPPGSGKPPSDQPRRGPGRPRKTRGEMTTPPAPTPPLAAPAPPLEPLTETVPPAAPPETVTEAATSGPEATILPLVRPVATPEPDFIGAPAADGG